MPEYRIEPFTVEHFDSLKQLFRSSFGVTVDFETFQKKYNTSSIGGKAISYVAVYTKTNKVVAHFAALPVRALREGEVMVSAQSSDAMTDERHRKKGLFKQLAEKVHLECRQRGIAFIFSQPNSESYHSFLNVFQFKCVDDIVRWDLKLKFKTAPLAKLLISSKFSGLFNHYCTFFLSRYKVEKPLSFTNSLATNDLRILRDKQYLEYKESGDKHFIQIGEAVFWIKLIDVLWIGEINDYEKVTATVLRQLRRLAFFMGYNTISFHLNEKVPKPAFIEHFSRYKTEPSTVFYINDQISSLNLILTGADYDTW